MLLFAHFLSFFTLFTSVASFRTSAAQRHHTRVARTRRAIQFDETDISVLLQAHNKLRALHNASPLEWSPVLAAKAASWADRCLVAHSQGSLMDSPYGETVVAATGVYTIQDAVATMASTKDGYPPSTSYSQFTQLVWKSTTRVGCAVARCEGVLTRTVTIYVCLYDPAGNVVGRLADNVEA